MTITKKRLVIGVDFDDVCFDFHEAFRLFHNEVHGTRVEFHHHNTYDIELVYGCDRETITRRILTFYQSDHHYAAPMIRETDRVTKLLRKSYRLEIITNRPESARSATFRWIKPNLGEVFDNAHFTNGFGALPHHHKRTKLEICKQIRAKVLIEDALHNAEEVAAGGVHVLMPDRPWNQKKTGPGITRVHSWDEIKEHLDKLRA